MRKHNSESRQALEAVKQYFDSQTVLTEDELELLEMVEYALLEYVHTHVAGTTAGLRIDTCAECGEDLRHPIHRRAES